MDKWHPCYSRHVGTFYLCRVRVRERVGGEKVKEGKRNRGGKKKKNDKGKVKKGGEKRGEVREGRGKQKKKVGGNVRLAYLLPLLLVLLQSYYYDDGARVLSINGGREWGGVLLRLQSQTGGETI